MIGHIKKEWIEKQTIEKATQIFCRILECQIVDIHEDLSVFAYLPFGAFFMGTWLSQKDIDLVCQTWDWMVNDE